MPKIKWIRIYWLWRYQRAAIRKTIDYIPWYFVQCKTGSSKVWIFFHPENRDLSDSATLISRLSSLLKWHFIAIEYPGYGVCFEQKINM